MKALIYIGFLFFLASAPFMTANAAVTSTTTTKVTTTVSDCPTRHHKKHVKKTYRHKCSYYQDCYQGCDQNCYRDRYTINYEDRYAYNNDPYACVSEESPASCTKLYYRDHPDNCYSCQY